MKDNFTHQEILLLTGTSFASRPWSTRDNPQNKGNSPAADSLQEACWNGLLPELLPELFEGNAQAGEMYLWQVKEANAFLELELGPLPVQPDRYFSLDPYGCLQTRCFN